MDRKKLIGISAVCVIIIAALCGYFFYFIKTPEYSLGIVKDSIEKHDVEKFKKHVDLDSLLSRGYDDLVAVGMDTDELKDNPLGKNFADGLIKMLKPTIVNSLKDEILRSVEGTNNEEASTESTEKADPSANVEEKTGMKSASFKGIAYTKKDGKTATVGIKINVPELDNDYTLDIKMRELDDGTWQVVEISNLKDYLEELNKAKKVALKAYVDETKVVTDKYNAELEQLKNSYSGTSVEFWTKYKENLSSCKDELSAIEVPAAGKELADMRLKFYEAANKQADLTIKILNGDRSADTMKQFNETKSKVNLLSKKRDAIISSTNKTN